MHQQFNLVRSRFWRVAYFAVVALFAAGLVSPAARGQVPTTIHSFIGPDNGTNPQAAMFLGRNGTLYGTTGQGGIYNAGTVYKINPDGTGFQTLHSFSGSDGAYPSAVIQGYDGALYGTTGDGTMFKVNTDGTGFQTLLSFIFSNAALFQGQDGTLYGTAENGGANGSVFKVNPDGTGFQTLYSFSASDGAPFAAVIQGQDGTLYGTTYSGGAYNNGTVFKINTDGTGFQTVYSFISGGGSYAAMIQGHDGALYGRTGGAYSESTVFKVNPDGTGFQTLYNSGSNGASPTYASVIQGQDDTLYGTTNEGGAYSESTVYKINPDGTGFQTLYSVSGSDGDYPLASVILGNDRFLYGTTYGSNTNNAGTVFRADPDGAGFQTLYIFSGGDGFYPWAAVLQGRDGSLYGTSQQGGAYNAGTVFKVNPDGTGFQTLYSFSGNDGDYPLDAVLQGKDGVLYGTTWSGGAYNDGTLFKINTDGSGFQTLHSFSGDDGVRPYAAVIQGRDGVLYGTTYGSNSDGGTVFRVNPDGTGFQTLHSFSYIGSGGANPFVAVLQGQNGALYGTTYSGGTNNEGTVFKVNTDGSGFQTLYNFSGGDGSGPAAMLQGQDGSLYGTTLRGGANYNGTVFKMNPDGTGFQTFYTFSGSDGAYPLVSMLQDQNGTLYGTTSGGGAYNNGTVFKVNTDGSAFQTLYNFSGSHGLNTSNVMLQGQDGSLYGTTQEDGVYGLGTVFKLALPPIDVTSKVQVSSSGLTYNSATKLYTGTLIIKNNNQLAIAGPIHAVLSHLPKGVTLVNANGTYNGAPYVTSNISSLAPRRLIHLTLQFSVTSGSGRIGYSITVYSGTP